MLRRNLVGTIAGFAVIALVGGADDVNASPLTTNLACNEAQIEYVKGVIREECGSWGGVANVICNGHSIDFQGPIECNAT